jgi:hypothetical protein
MTRFPRNLLAALLMAGSVIPAIAADAPASPPPPVAAPAAESVDVAERAALMQAIRGRMHEMMQTQDADARKQLMEAQLKDLDALAALGGPAPGMMRGGPGMGAGPMAMGPGNKSNCRMGMGQGMGPGPGGKKPCMAGGGAQCPRADGLEHRLDAMEKRLDLMQSSLEYLMRH